MGVVLRKITVVAASLLVAAAAAQGVDFRIGTQTTRSLNADSPNTDSADADVTRAVLFVSLARSEEGTLITSLKSPNGTEYLPAGGRDVSGTANLISPLWHPVTAGEYALTLYTPDGEETVITRTVEEPITLAPPEVTTLEVEDGRVYVEWEPVAGAVLYRVALLDWFATINFDLVNTAETSVEFTDLPAGSYELRIEARNFERLGLKHLPDAPSIGLTTQQLRLR